MASVTFRSLLVKNSKENADYIVKTLEKYPERMEELMNCFFDEDLRVCQYASWPAGMIADNNPNLILPYIEKMLLNLDAPHHDAVIRNTFRTLQNIEIPEELEGLAYDKGLEFLANPQNAIAIRVFAMTVCGNIAMKYPELKHELMPIIEEQLPHGSAGFKNRGSKVLAALRSLG